MDWDPDFLERSPMFVPLQPHAAALANRAEWPPRAALQALFDARDVRTLSGLTLTLTAPGSEPYESTLYERGQMQHRERNWHDLLNALTWLAYPRSKAALNAAHARALADHPGGPGRGRARDALTLFDESGAIVVSNDPDLLDDLRAFRWKRLFWEKRERFVERARVFVFGHALLEKGLRPYVGMTAHALLLECEASCEVGEIDARVAESIAALDTPQVLSPLPVLGVPGWWAENAEPAFYDNERYFRPRRLRPQHSRGPAQP